MGYRPEAQNALWFERSTPEPGSAAPLFGGRAGGSWALLPEGGITLRHTLIEVDVDAAVVAGSRPPQREAWTEESSCG